MANTTFKGPVRSQNGFQELVDGVWVPVGGGGGGGATQKIYTPYTTGSNGSELDVVLPGVTEATPGEIGQVWEVYITPTIQGPNLSYFFSISPEVYSENIVFFGTIFKSVSTSTYAQNIEQVYPSVDINNQNVNSYSQLVSGKVVITYIGITNFGFGDIYSYIIDGQLQVYGLTG